jgi:hypothetical protein
MNETLRRRFAEGKLTLAVGPGQSEESRVMNSFIRGEAGRGEAVVEPESLRPESLRSDADAGPGSPGRGEGGGS